MTRESGGKNLNQDFIVKTGENSLKTYLNPLLTIVDISATIISIVKILAA
jgi:hypothetical protein